MPDLETVLFLSAGGAFMWALAAGLQAFLNRRDGRPAKVTRLGFAPRVYVVTGEGARWLAEAPTQRLYRTGELADLLAARPSPRRRYHEPATVRFERVA